MDLEQLTAVGAQLGFLGAELRKWFDREHAVQTNKRAVEREESQLAAEES